MIKKFNWIIILLLIGCSGSSEAVAAREINENAAADADGQIRISNVSGKIEVTGWNKNEVEVRGTLGSGAKLKFDHDGDRTTIKVTKQDGVRNVESSDVIVKVPQGSEVLANGVSADIEVRNVRGVQRLEAVSGEIDADVFASDFEAKTVSGNIRVDGHGENSLVTITTISGNSAAKNIAGELEASTVSGDIEISAGVLSRARLKATNGDIDITGDLASGGRFESETINGDITVRFAQGGNLDVEIETFNGDIDNCFGEEAERKSKYAPGRSLRFTRGNGDRRVRVKTLNGDVDICSKQIE